MHIVGQHWSRELGTLMDLLVDRVREGEHTGDVARRLGVHFGRAGESFERVLGEVDMALMVHAGGSAPDAIVRAVALGWADAFPLADDDIHREPITGLIDPATLVRRLDAVRRLSPGAVLNAVVLEVTDIVQGDGDPVASLRADLTLINAVELVRPQLPTVLSWTRFGPMRAGAIVDPACSADQAVHDAEALLSAAHRPWKAAVWTEPVPEQAREVVELVRDLAS